jgi:hypothetical protein
VSRLKLQLSSLFVKQMSGKVVSAASDACILV